MQPGQMCSIASGKFCHSALFSRGRRKAPARATGPQAAGNPQPGECAETWYCCGFFPARAALSRATGSLTAENT
ncbi:hypothetical protein HMPREF1570_2645 [Klebsiella oxytoca KA-2]|nr:hypothetical protein HMPREF1570_2645 [Klebsiella oxytoca KA-2]